MYPFKTQLLVKIAGTQIGATHIQLHLLKPQFAKKVIQKETRGVPPISMPYPFGRNCNSQSG
jgi:hypothetical protein